MLLRWYILVQTKTSVGAFNARKHGNAIYPSDEVSRVKNQAGSVYGFSADYLWAS